jgi:hypothetical protein
MGQQRSDQGKGSKRPGAAAGRSPPRRFFAQDFMSNGGFCLHSDVDAIE